MVKRAPRRTCVGCRTTRAKPELRRFVVTPAGVTPDPDQTLPGRGAYVCPDPRCVDRIDRAHGQPLRRALPDADITTTSAAMTGLRAALATETPDGGPGAMTRPPARQASSRDDTDQE